MVRFVREPNSPPSLVITDGSAAVWFSPQHTVAGAAFAAEFGERLIQTAGRWEETCRAMASPAPYRPDGR